MDIFLLLLFVLYCFDMYFIDKDIRELRDLIKSFIDNK